MYNVDILLTDVNTLAKVLFNAQLPSSSSICEERLDV